MSVPFTFKQLYREIFDFGGSVNKFSLDELHIFNAYIAKPFSVAIFSKFEPQCPLSVDGFMSFVAAGHEETGEKFDAIAWSYVEGYAKHNLFAGESSMSLKACRSAVDFTLKASYKESELTDLWTKNVKKIGDTITPKELIGVLKVAMKKVALLELLRSCQGRGKGKRPPPKVNPPKAPRGAGGSAASPASPKTPASPPPTPASPASPMKKEPPPEPEKDKAPPAPAPSKDVPEAPAKEEAPSVPAEPTATPPPAAAGETPAAAPPPAGGDTPEGGAAAGGAGEPAKAETPPAPTDGKAPPPAPPVTPPAQPAPPAPAAPPKEPAAAPSPEQPAAQPKRKMQGIVNLEELEQLAAAVAKEEPTGPSAQLVSFLADKQAKNDIGVGANLGGGEARLPPEILQVAAELDQRRDDLRRQLDKELEYLASNNDAIKTLKGRVEDLQARNTIPIGGEAQLLPAVENAADMNKLQAKMEKWISNAKQRQIAVRHEVSRLREAEQYEIGRMTALGGSPSPHPSLSPQQYPHHQQQQHLPSSYSSSPAAAHPALAQQHPYHLPGAGSPPPHPQAQYVDPAYSYPSRAAEASEELHIQSALRVSRFNDDLTERAKALKEKEKVLQRLRKLQQQEEALTKDLQQNERKVKEKIHHDQQNQNAVLEEIQRQRRAAQMQRRSGSHAGSEASSLHSYGAAYKPGNSPKTALPATGVSPTAPGTHLESFPMDTAGNSGKLSAEKANKHLSNPPPRSR